jgi:hypothetical protein
VHWQPPLTHSLPGGQRPPSSPHSHSPPGPHPSASDSPLGPISAVQSAQVAPAIPHWVALGGALQKPFPQQPVGQVLRSHGVATQKP